MQSLPSDELLEKFSAAFYDAQISQNKSYNIEDELLETFDESFFTNIDAYEDEDDYFADLLISKCSSASTDSVADTFDYTELSQSFEDNTTSETTTTVSWQSDLEDCFPRENSAFFVPPPFCDARKSPDAIFQNNYQTLEHDAFLTATTKNGSDFTNFLRHVPGDSLDIFAEVNEYFRSHNHNIGTQDACFVLDGPKRQSERLRSLDCNGSDVQQQ